MRQVRVRYSGSSELFLYKFILFNLNNEIIKPILVIERGNFVEVPIAVEV